MKEPMSDQIIKHSAFDGKPEATTVVFEWKDIDLIDERGDVSDECYSSTFGTTKTLFHLTAQIEYKDEDSEDGYSFFEDPYNKSLNFYLNIDKNSNNKKVFIYSILANSSGVGKSKHKNKGIFIN